MTKYIMECVECKVRYKTKKKKWKRYCPECKCETTFSEVTKTPVANKHAPFDFICLSCRTVRHGPPIPKQCSCGQRFQQHAENTTLADVLYNMIVGSSSKEKGYLLVTVGRDGFIWWTPPKDEYGDNIDPFLGDSKRTGHFSHEDHIGSMRTDDLRLVHPQTTTIISRKKDFRS